MRKEDIDKKIQEVVDELQSAKEHLHKDEFVFECSHHCGIASGLLRTLAHDLDVLADEQEIILGERERSKGYEVV